MQRARLASILVVTCTLAAAFWYFVPRNEATAPAKQAPVKTGEEKGPVVLALVPTIADRFVAEPCNRVPGGGLSSLPGFFDEMEQHYPGFIRVCLGDATLAWGGLARNSAAFHYNEAMPVAGLKYVAAGEGELGLGVEYIRDVLTRFQGLNIFCANAADANGLPLMAGWELLKSNGRGVLLVGVASESLQPEIRRRGSDVRLLPADLAVAKARADGLERAKAVGVDVDVSVLIVHGTVDEAEALLRKSPGFTLAAASHGGALPDAEPRKVGDAPIFYGGQGVRFLWRMFLPPGGGPPNPSLVRIGQQQLMKPSALADPEAMYRQIARDHVFDEVLKTPGDRPLDPRGLYVGAKKCAECHAAIAAQHASSPHGQPSAPFLDSDFAGSTGCIGCHTTAPYDDGGWRGVKDRSDLAAISCEACHGPGEKHVAAPAAGWGHAGFARCVECHLPDRSPGFDAEAAWKRSGHGAR